MRSYFFNFHPVRPRRAVAVIAFERVLRGAADLLTFARDLVRCWRERAPQRCQLARLDLRLLRDVGITAAEAQCECNRPFWRG